MKAQCKAKRGRGSCSDFMAVFSFHHHHLKSTLIEFALQQAHQRESRRQNVPKAVSYCKWQHVYCRNTAAAPNTSLAEPRATELASLEKKEIATYCMLETKYIISVPDMGKHTPVGSIQIWTTAEACFTAPVWLKTPRSWCWPWCFPNLTVILITPNNASIRNGWRTC